MNELNIGVRYDRSLKASILDVLRDKLGIDFRQHSTVQAH